MNRRNFIELTTSSAAAIMLPSTNLLSSSQPLQTMPENFKVKVLATNWGFNGSLDDYCAAVKKEGYDGIEIWWPLEQKGQEELLLH